MNLKTEVTRKQSTPNFPKNEHFLPYDTWKVVNNCCKALYLRYLRRMLLGVHPYSTYTKFSEKLTFLPPDMHTYVYQGVRNVCFSENVVCFVFLFPPCWNSPFSFMTAELLHEITRVGRTNLETKFLVSSSDENGDQYRRIL